MRPRFLSSRRACRERRRQQAVSALSVTPRRGVSPDPASYLAPLATTSAAGLVSSLSASRLQPDGIAVSDFARVKTTRAENGTARSRAAQPSSSPDAGRAMGVPNRRGAYALRPACRRLPAGVVSISRPRFRRECLARSLLRCMESSSHQQKGEPASACRLSASGHASAKQIPEPTRPG